MGYGEMGGLVGTAVVHCSLVVVCKSKTEGGHFRDLIRRQTKKDKQFMTDLGIIYDPGTNVQC